MASGSIGGAGAQTTFTSAQSINCTLPAYTYPNGTITFNDVGDNNYWYNRGAWTGSMNVYLCDSAGNNKVFLFTITLNSGRSDKSTKSATVSGATGLAGKALYLIATTASGYDHGADIIQFRNYTGITISTAVQSYTVTTAVSPANTGTLVASKSPANPGDNIILTASPATGYQLSSYSSSPTVSISNNQFTMPGNAVTITANFTKKSYTLTVSKGTGISSVSGGGSKEYASSNAISATASSGYSFKNWTSNNGGTFANANAASTNFTMPAGNVTVTANGQVNSYALTVSKGTGIASVTGGGTVNYGSSNNISATASTGYSFKNWTSNNGGTFGNANAASTTFTMPVGATTVTANAQINSYTLTVAKGTGGSSVTGGGTVNYGSSNSISATAATGYTFKNWTSNNGGTFGNANSASTTFTMPAGNVTVTANFTINSYTLTTAASPAAGGSVTAGGSMNYNSSKSLTATASTGYTFSSWSKTSGTLSSTTSNPTTFTIGAGNATVTANFTHNQYTLTLSKSPNAGGSVSGGGTKYYNDSCSISATPATGYSFKNWTTSSDGSLANANAVSTTFTMPDGDATVTANFTHDVYTLSSSVSGGGSVTMGTDSGYYDDVISITATPNTGYAFAGWTATGGTIASASSASTTITMPEANTTVTATFEKITYSVTCVSSPSGGGTVASDPSSATMGDSVSVSQEPATGYLFDYWETSPAVTISGGAFTMPASNVTLTAHFFIAKSTAELSTTTLTGGSHVTMTIDSASAGFSHKYKLSFGTNMETEFINVPAGVTSVSVYIPVGWSIALHNETSRSGGTLTLQTYSGTTLLGTYTISDLTYEALDGVIPTFRVWRADESGNKFAGGVYGKYSFVMPDNVPNWRIEAGGLTANKPASSGDILPGARKEFATTSAHSVSLVMVYDEEIITVTRQLPQVILVGKNAS